MSEYQIIRFCAPTLAGLKTASLFCCDAPDEAELLGQLRHWNTSLAPKGLRMLPLRIWNGRALIYLYRPKALARDLACEDAARLLNGSGYDGTEPSARRTASRTRSACSSAIRRRTCAALLKTRPEITNSPVTGRSTETRSARAPCSTSSNAARAAIWPPGPVGPGWSGSLWPSEPELP